MPLLSVAVAMTPPSASISLTRWLLPMPPMAGLQLIWPRVSTLWVSSRVFTPMRAAAKAASVPAWPPPITITSKREGKSTTHLGPVRGRLCLKIREGGKYRDIGSVNEVFCTKNSQPLPNGTELAGQSGERLSTERPAYKELKERNFLKLVFYVYVLSRRFLWISHCRPLFIGSAGQDKPVAFLPGSLGYAGYPLWTER